MELFYGLFGGALFSAIIGYFFYRKQKIETKIEYENQLKEIKKDNEEKVKKIKDDSDTKLVVVQEEFKSLNKRVSNINLEPIPETVKNEILSINSELVSWIETLEHDFGEIENKLNQKVLKKELELRNNSDSLRKYILEIINFINQIIITLNSKGKNITWNKPNLPANLFEANIRKAIVYNNQEVLIIQINKCNILKKHLNIELSKPIKDGEYSSNDFILIDFKADDNVKIDLCSKGEFDYIDTLLDTSIKNVEEKIKDVFEHILVTDLHPRG